MNRLHGYVKSFHPFLLAILLACTIGTVHAGDTLKKGVIGAAAGALIGAAVDGSEGAAKGALIGGGAGLVAGALDDDDDRRRHKNKKWKKKKHKKKHRKHRDRVIHHGARDRRR